MMCSAKLAAAGSRVPVALFFDANATKNEGRDLIEFFDQDLRRSPIHEEKTSKSHVTRRVMCLGYHTLHVMPCV
jgi:hypothetical protein